MDLKIVALMLLGATGLLVAVGCLVIIYLLHIR